MKLLNENESTLARKILHRGFKEVAQTVSEIVQQEVKIDNIDIRLIEGHEPRPYRLMKKGDVHLLTTEIIGDLSGKSFLCFQESEVQTLVKVCLPTLRQGTATPSLTEAMLLELDNMLSANVVTHISNYLNVQIYGDVPKHTIVEAEEVERLIEKDPIQHPEENLEPWFLLANLEFSFVDGEVFRPSFVWKFTNRFLQAIKEHVNETAV